MLHISPLPCARLGVLAAVLLALAPGWPSPVRAAPGALSLAESLRLGRLLRPELRAADARVQAARQRPAILASLDDPIVTPSIDHKPVDPMMKTDRSIRVEQSFPLSKVRSHRRRSAEADIGRFLAEGNRTALKVDVEVAQAFFMLRERRQVRQIMARQAELAEQLVKLAAARHSVGVAGQADVLRMEMEQARLRGRLVLASAEARSAEIMFNTALGREPYTAIPGLQDQPLPEQADAVDTPQAALEVALRERAELRISDAEIARARAEIAVMKSMYGPMAMVGAGMAETGAAGRGYMFMVGLSVPIWTGRLKAGVREADAMAAMAQADREAMLRMIGGDVAASLEALQGAMHNARTYRADLLPRAERAIGPAMTAYASGALPLSSVLDAGRALWAVQEESVMADTALALAWIRHRSALGTFGELK